MTNLLTETLEALREAGFHPADVLWISDGTVSCDWQTFATAADREYDAGFGAREVSETLVVVGEDWWLERWEYDGSEGWALKTLPTLPPVSGVPEMFLRSPWPMSGT